MPFYSPDAKYFDHHEMIVTNDDVESVSRFGIGISLDPSVGS